MVRPRHGGAIEAVPRSPSFQAILRDNWPHPRRPGEGIMYNFGSDYAMVGLTWFGRRGGYGCEVIEHPDADQANRPAALDEWIDDAWGALTLEVACAELEEAMRDILVAEGKDPDSFWLALDQVENRVLRHAHPDRPISG